MCGPRVQTPCSTARQGRACGVCSLLACPVVEACSAGKREGTAGFTHKDGNPQQHPRRLRCFSQVVSRPIVAVCSVVPIIAEYQPPPPASSLSLVKLRYFCQATTPSPDRPVARLQYHTSYKWASSLTHGITHTRNTHMHTLFVKEKAHSTGRVVQ